MIPWVAIPKYEVPFTQNKIEFKRVGGQFIGMNNLDRSIINRAVLRKLRETSYERKWSERKINISESFDLNKGSVNA